MRNTEDAARAAAWLGQPMSQSFLSTGATARAEWLKYSRTRGFGRGVNGPRISSSRALLRRFEQA